MPKFYKMPTSEWNKLPKLEFQNVCLDFSIKPRILKRYSKDKLLMGVESSWSQDEVSYERKVAQRSGDKMWIRYSGSPCNNYVRRVR